MVMRLSDDMMQTKEKTTNRKNDDNVRNCYLISCTNLHTNRKQVNDPNEDMFVKVKTIIPRAFPNR